MGVLDPLKVTITNYEGDGEALTAPWHPQQADLGERSLPFGPEILIEREDFSEDPPRKYKRLSPGEMVRLRYAYIIRCDEVIKDASGVVVALECTYFPDSKSGSDTSGLKPKGVVHWVHGEDSVPVRVRRYEHLFQDPMPDLGDLDQALNPNSLTETEARIEPAMASSDESRFQFERQGYFCRDSADASLFHRTVTLRDSFKP